MKIKEQRKLTQSTVNEIICFTEFCTNNVTRLGEEVLRKLSEAGITEDIPGLLELFYHTSKYCQPFDGLGTSYRQMIYYRKHFHLVVSSCICYVPSPT